MALRLAKVEEIRCLLAAGFSQRRVAREASVSRQTVSNILHGRWAPLLWARIEDQLTEEEPGPQITPAQAKRIRSRAREAARHKRPESLQKLFAEHGPPGLELKPDDQAGYIRLRRKLQAEGKMAPDGAYDPRDAA